MIITFTWDITRTAEGYSVTQRLPNGGSVMWHGLPDRATAEQLIAERKAMMDAQLKAFIDDVETRRAAMGDIWHALRPHMQQAAEAEVNKFMKRFEAFQSRTSEVSEAQKPSDVPRTFSPDKH